MRSIFKISRPKLKTTESPDSVHLDESINYEMICNLVCDLGNQMMGQYYSKNSNPVTYDDVSLLIDYSHAGEHFNWKVMSEGKERCKKLMDENELELKTLIPVTQSLISREHGVQDRSDLDQVSYIDNCDKIYQYYKSKLKKHATRRLTSKEFDADWEYVATLFSALGVSDEEIEKYKSRPEAKQNEHVKEDYINMDETEDEVSSLPTDADPPYAKAHVKFPLDPSSQLQERKELGVIILLGAIFLGLSTLFFILVTKHKTPKNIKELLVILALLIVTGFPMFRCIIKRQIKTKNKSMELRRRQLYSHA